MPRLDNATIRPARPEDGEAVAAMCAALSRHELKPAPAFDAEAFRRAGFGARPAFAGHIAEIDGRPVGYALHCPDYDTDRMAQSVFLVDLYVAERWRRRGLGRALVAAVARAGSTTGAELAAWTVEAANTEARGFYARVGHEAAAILMCGAGGRKLERLAAAPSPPGLELRAPLSSECPGVAAMIEALLVEMGWRPPADVERRLMADGFGPRPAFAMMVAAESGHVVGYALHWLLYDTETAAPGLLLSDLYVMPRARGRGIGLALMGAAARDALAAGARFMTWQVLKTNASARAFYRKVAEEWPEVVFCYASGDEFRALLGDARGCLTPQGKGAIF